MNDLGSPPDSTPKELEVNGRRGEADYERVLEFMLDRFRIGDEESLELAVRLALRKGLPLLEIYEALRTESSDSSRLRSHARSDRLSARCSIRV